MSNHDDSFWAGLMKGQHAGQDSFGNFLAEREASGGDLSDLYEGVDAVDTGGAGFFSNPQEIGGEHFNSVSQLTDKIRDENEVPENPKVGTKVQFKANVGAVLSYENPPEPDAIGEVVPVKTGSGQITEHDGFIFAKWPDGQVRSIAAKHLFLVSSPEESKTASSERMKVASLGDLNGFLKVSSDTLINKSTKDLWSYRQEGGSYVVERLFQDNGEPLRVG